MNCFKSDSNLADIWFLQANVTTIFDNLMVSTLQNTGKCADYLSTIHIHAILMFAGWAVFLNLKCLLRRYIVLNKKKRLHLMNTLETCLEVKIGKKTLFIIKLLNLIFFKYSGVILITAGLGFGFYSSNGLPNLPHLILGISAYVCVILQLYTNFL